MSLRVPFLKREETPAAAGAAAAAGVAAGAAAGNEVSGRGTAKHLFAVASAAPSPFVAAAAALAAASHGQQQQQLLSCRFFCSFCGDENAPAAAAAAAYKVHAAPFPSPQPVNELCCGAGVYRHLPAAAETHPQECCCCHCSDKNCCWQQQPQSSNQQPPQQLPVRPWGPCCSSNSNSSTSCVYTPQKLGDVKP